MIKEWLDEYKPKSTGEGESALREIIQEIALAGLSRSGFFEKAAFYGGTSLRVFYGLNRFSEDLDFSLLETNPDFDLHPYLNGLVKEFNALGIDVTVKEKVKSKKTAIGSAFLKPGTEWKELILRGITAQEKIGMRPEIKIKLEVDTNPPPGFSTEEKLLLRPFSCYIKCFTAPDLFAGKMHAILFRKWKERVKGRDWFDMEWFVKNNIPLHLNHFITRSVQSGDLSKKSLTPNQFVKLVMEKIDRVSMNDIQEDIMRFIPDEKPLEIWSKDYFKEVARRIRFVKK